MPCTGEARLDHRINPLDPTSRLCGLALTARAGARGNLAEVEAEPRARIENGAFETLLDPDPQQAIRYID